MNKIFLAATCLCRLVCRPYRAVCLGLGHGLHLVHSVNQHPQGLAWRCFGILLLIASIMETADALMEIWRGRRR